MFATDAKFIIEGEGFMLEDGDLESGGFVVGDTSINKIEVYLTLETLQGDATAEQAKDLGWEIGGAINPTENQEENFDKNRLLDETGNELDPNNTDLTENTTYQVVDEQGNGYKFTYALNETNKTATITGYVGTPTSLDIPKTIKVKQQDYVVTSIGDFAFYNYTDLMSIKLPDSLISIGMGAFAVCTGLTQISIPDSVEEIGDFAFVQCANITTLKLSNSLKLIGTRMFAECTSLKSLEIPNGVTQLGFASFDGCTSINSIVIPNSVTKIGVGAFQRCSNLSTIVIPNSVKTIGEGAFALCTNLITVNLPDNLISIENNLFYGCSKLKSITIPNSVINFGDDIFDGCDDLLPSTIENGIKYLGNSTNKFVVAWQILDVSETSYYINEECKFIHSDCFKDSSISSVTLPENVTSIGSSAFLNCANLNIIEISGALNRLGDSAFSNCHNLEPSILENGIKYLGNESNKYIIALGTINGTTQVSYTIKEGCKFIYNSCFSHRKAEEIIIPDSVISINNGAFQECSNLTTIAIPNNVKIISQYVFYRCSNLTTTIGEGWVKSSDNSAVDANTLLKDIDYEIKRA